MRRILSDKTIKIIELCDIHISRKGIITLWISANRMKRINISDKTKREYFEYKNCMYPKYGYAVHKYILRKKYFNKFVERIKMKNENDLI